MTKFRSILNATAVAVVCAALCACASFTSSPSTAQVAAIQSACVLDAAVRPTVDVLTVLATPAEIDAIKAARLVIDPVCANPSAPIATNAATIFSESTAQIANILVQLQARKKAAVVAPSASGAA